MRFVIALFTVLSLACATASGDAKKEPPVWVPITLTCLGCIGPPIAALAILFLKGPKERVEGYTAKMENSPYSGKDVGLLIDTLYKTWDAKFHNVDKVRPFLDRLDIYWIVGVPGADGVPAVQDPYGRGKVAGFMDAVGTDPLINRARVRVTFSDGFPLAQTALAHELVHGFLAITTGDPGNAHLSAPCSWTLDVQGVVNETMRTMSGGGEKLGHGEPEAVDIPL